MQLNPIELLVQGIYAETATPAIQLKELVATLHPVKTQHQLIRIGGENDGGYLLPDDFRGIAACFSPGVADNASFEQDLLVKTGIQSHLADYSVEGPPVGFSPASFTKKFLGGIDNDKFVTLESWVKERANPDAQEDYILQMDIEGGEFVTLLSCPISMLQKFRIIVLEVHQVHAWAQQNFFEIVKSCFEKLLQHFYVVHNHPNNNDGLINIGGFLAPRTFELSFIRKDRASFLGYTAEIPHALDRPNVLHRPDLSLPSDWFRADTPSSSTRSLLCRPQGGLNDILCSVGRCWAYAQKHNRTLLVDTRLSGIRDDFWRYFSIDRESTLVDKNLDYSWLDSLSTFPRPIQGRVSTLMTDYSSAKGGFMDLTSGELVSFDFEKDYQEELLVYEQGWLGGELMSAQVLEKLRFTEDVGSRIKKSIEVLPSAYCGIHIRHTDYTTDYKNLLINAKKHLEGRIVLVCSDNLDVINYAKDELEKSKVIRLSTFESNDGKRLHYHEFGVDQYARNVEALTDLVALALSEELIFGNVNEAGRPSGFSWLAQHLNSNKGMVKSMLS